MTANHTHTNQRAGQRCSVRTQGGRADIKCLYADVSPAVIVSPAHVSPALQ
jgi:hypothetical protein